MPNKNSLVKSTVGVILGTVFLVAMIPVAKYVIAHHIDRKLKNLNIQASSIDLDIFGRSVNIHDISSNETTESSQRISLKVKVVRINGIRIIPLILHKVLYAHTLVIDSGRIEIDKNYAPTQSNSSTPNLVGVFIDSIETINVQLAVLNDTTLEYRGMIDLTIGGLQVPDVAGTTPWLTSKFDFFNILLRDLRFHETGSLYTTEVQKISANSYEKSLTIDSISLTPLQGKYEFARKKGKQTDRITLSIPQIKVSGIDLSRLNDSIIHILDLSIGNASLQLFRDKRIAFVPGNDIPLPQEMISKFPFTIAIDSVHIHEARIFYEVFPEKGFHAGNVTFEKLEATLDHLSNHAYYTNITQATLVAHANLLQKGFISGTFTIPYEKHKRYAANGVITHLPLPLLNPMLENMASTRMVSGKLNRLKFEFDYNDISSTGSILIDYEDLKVQSLTKDKEAEPNEFKSFVLNVLLRNNKGKNVSKEKRTGVIKFERDMKKSIFNLWFKSILSGLENSVIDLSGKDDE